MFKLANFAITDELENELLTKALVYYFTKISVNFNKINYDLTVHALAKIRRFMRKMSKKTSSTFSQTCFIYMSFQMQFIFLSESSENS